MACQGALGSTTPLRDAVGECSTFDCTHSVSSPDEMVCGGQCGRPVWKVGHCLAGMVVKEEDVVCL